LAPLECWLATRLDSLQIRAIRVLKLWAFRGAGLEGCRNANSANSEGESNRAHVGYIAPGD